MKNVNNSLAVDAFERALILIDRQKVVAALSDKNQNKRRDQSEIDVEFARLRSALFSLKSNSEYAPVLHRNETGVYRGRIEIMWGRKLNWRERLFAFFGGEVRYRSIALTEGPTGKVIQSVAMTVGTEEADKANDKPKAKKAELDEISKVVESEPLKAEMREDGNSSKPASGGGGESHES